jgi:hypothetical protein
MMVRCAEAKIMEKVGQLMAFVKSSPHNRWSTSPQPGCHTIAISPANEYYN